VPARLVIRRRPPTQVLGTAERLVEAAEAILAESGLEGLSLREIARQAGVTHGAPLRHYASFSALLAEVAARGFRVLDEAVESAAASVAPGAGPTDRLAAGARAYLDCAAARPGVFTLMFRPELIDASHPGFAHDSQRAFEQLVRLVRNAQDSGWHSARDTRQLAGSLWAAVHGLASLWVHGAYAGVLPKTPLDLAFDTTIDLMLGESSRPTSRRRR
jgi:AcrR family transcriptional regulator